MLSNYKKYLGKTIKMNGTFNVYTDKDTKKEYYTCIIADATACCTQGLEFLLAGNKKYPDDYPKINKNITVTGVFETYKDGKNIYVRLNNAEIKG